MIDNTTDAHTQLGGQMAHHHRCHHKPLSGCHPPPELTRSQSCSLPLLHLRLSAQLACQVGGTRVPAGRGCSQVKLWQQGALLSNCCTKRPHVNYVYIKTRRRRLFREGASLILRPETGTILYLHFHRVPQWGTLIMLIGKHSYYCNNWDEHETIPVTLIL